MSKKGLKYVMLPAIASKHLIREGRVLVREIISKERETKKQWVRRRFLLKAIGSALYHMGIPDEDIPFLMPYESKRVRHK